LFLLRVLQPFAVLLLLGLAIAYIATKDRKWLGPAWSLAAQVEVLLVVAFGLPLRPRAGFPALTGHPLQRLLERRVGSFAASLPSCSRASPGAQDLPFLCCRCNLNFDAY
jgi:hypothetical protein